MKNRLKCGGHENLTVQYLILCKPQNLLQNDNIVYVIFKQPPSYNIALIAAISRVTLQAGVYYTLDMTADFCCCGNLSAKNISSHERIFSAFALVPSLFRNVCHSKLQHFYANH